MLCLDVISFSMPTCVQQRAISAVEVIEARRRCSGSTASPHHKSMPVTYIIHGATGAQSAPLLNVLSQAGKHAVAAVRNTDAVAGPSVQVDHRSVRSLTDAYRGAHGVFVHLPQAPEDVRVAYANNIVQAIDTAKPARVLTSTSGSIVDTPGSALQAAPDSAIAILIDGVQRSGVSSVVIAPRLYLENLLLPMVIGGVHGDGVLGYPIREEFPVSWSSHLDVADVAAQLFDRPGVTGVVGVGQLPGLLGADLAAALAHHLKRDVCFQSVLPADFGKQLEPLLGPATTAMAGFYQALWQTPANTIDTADPPPVAGPSVGRDFDIFRRPALAFRTKRRTSANRSMHGAFFLSPASSRVHAGQLYGGRCAGAARPT
ncbi:SDR family oxidoreductase, partial [Xanthomonas nasturtii]|uniref:SDR family oxidoreductase n=1 Tax=Xanthomonas nasturtii TaxID=1843581 RepID=UPI003558E8F8